MRSTDLSVLAAAMVLCASPLAAQTTDSTPEITPPGVASTAVDSVRRLYGKGKYADAIAVADTAMRRGAGSTELQAWRLASLIEHPVAGTTPLRTARRMASMHPLSPWAWMGLAMAAAATPDSGVVARAAAIHSLSLAPRDSAARDMAIRALRRAGYQSQAESLADSVQQVKLTP